MVHISKKGDFLKNFTYFMFLVIFYAMLVFHGSLKLICFAFRPLAFESSFSVIS